MKNKKLAGQALASAFVLSLMAGMSAAPVLADGVYPRLEGEISSEFESDHVLRSDDAGAKVSDTYPTIEMGVGLLFNPYFSLQGTFLVEPVGNVRNPRGPGEDHFIEDLGGYAEELYLQFQMGPARLFAGKFDAAFGQAWDLTPGLYGTDFVEDYELVERLGFGVGLSAQGSPLGDVDLTASVFTLDSTGLSDSLGTRRGPVKLADGGAGNTAKLDSFSIALDGRNMPLFSNIAWHLGYSHQSKEAKDNGNGSDEKGFVAGLYGSHKLTDNMSLEWVGEVAHILNQGGAAADVSYYTAGAVLTFSERYNVAVAHTTRAFDVAAGANFNDTNTQFSVGMAVYDGWTIDVGYKIAEEGGVESETVGVLLAKTFAFNTGQ